MIQIRYTLRKTGAEGRISFPSEVSYERWLKKNKRILQTYEKTEGEAK